MTRRSFLYTILFAFFLAGATGQYENCTGDLDAINDGRCDGENNIDECHFDGGDCCYYSCENDRLYPCGISGYSCLDPDAVGNAGGSTNESALVNPCSTDISQTWLVNDTASATSFAEAVNCSGGTFDVRWLGGVLIDHTISIPRNTTVYVAGEGLGAEVNGDGKRRLFNVEGAVFHIDGLTLSHGNATYGGAIAATCSILSFNNTSYSENIASSYGGAVYIDKSSTAIWDGKTAFADNHGKWGGGAVAVSTSSTATWSGSIEFSSNTVVGDEGIGGAVYVHNSSKVSWDGLALFNNNYASLFGGALWVTESSIASWGGITSFVANTAPYGGAVFIQETSSVSWTAETSFINNTASGNGGALQICTNSVASWGGITSFVANTAAFGGAVYIQDNSSVSWTAETSFINNTANVTGGALNVFTDSAASWSGITSFVANTAAYGGAVYIIETSSVSWTAETSFINNTASKSGGALHAYSNSVASWGGITSFVANAAPHGGAVYIQDSSASWTAETSFTNNTASGSGGAFHASTNSAASWGGITSFVANTAAIGGAVYIMESSSVSWTAETSFINNTANVTGGALNVFLNSAASWSGITSFVANTAPYGGAVYIRETSSVWSTAETSFTNNTASGNGGAFHAYINSVASWGGITSFVANTAAFGGAVYIHENAGVSWTAAASFINNTAFGNGGALNVYINSVASLHEATSFVANTAAFGGAVYIQESSSVSWTAQTSFTNNTASGNGGALNVFINSVASWGGITSFVANTAAHGGSVHIEKNSSVLSTAAASFINNVASGNGEAFNVYINSAASWDGITSSVASTAAFGGAVFIQDASSFSWTAETCFVNNSATGLGGALYIDNMSVASWDGAMSFIANTAGYGGAFFVDADSIASWNGVTSFVANTAGYGGAVSVHDNSIVSWTGKTNFINNEAWTGNGGALRVRFESNVSWTGNTSFTGNSANASGGAVYVSTGANITVGGDTHFLDNYATVEGGAICVYVGYDQAILPYFSKGKDVVTILRGNNCGANGGGIALIGAVVTRFSLNMMFSENHAGVAGGAVYMSGVSFGPLFEGTKFYSNSAVVGGGVYSTGSGTAAIGDEDEDLQQNSTIFIGCEFVGNRALTTGGALNTGAGKDRIESTFFVRNSAKIGGALRLVGTASIEGCKFIDNLSDEGEGPGVFNDGVISGISNCTFVGNVFNCDPGYYLDHNKTNALFDTICKGCVTQCQGCPIEGKEPICLETLDHSIATGGNAIIESLLIEPGYWRATNTSINIFACYNAQACVGGLTGREDYCRLGYEGPYCSICSDGYTASLGFACTKCSDSIAGSITVAVFVAVVFLFAFFAFLSYMLSGESTDTDKGIVARITRFIPLQSVKIVIVVWQILTQFSTVTNVVFPSVYQVFLDGVDILNFDLSWVVSVGCIIDTDFHDQLLFATLGPLVCMAILGCTYSAAMRRNDLSEDARKVVSRKHVSMVLLLTFLVYSSVSSTLFEMFVCDDLDDGKNYLRADYRIECGATKHNILQIYAAFMIVLYVVGIPTFYGILLYNNREELMKNAGREKDESIKPITDLWKPYRPDRFYYEIIECVRRVMLTGALVFIYPNTAAQIAVAIMMVTFFMITSETLAPHASPWDTWCSRSGHAIVFTSFFLALLLKVDVSGERASSQRVFEIVLIAAHSCLVLIVVVEAGAMVLALREGVDEDAKPRTRLCLNVSSPVVGNNGGFLVEEAPPSFEEKSIS